MNTLAHLTAALAALIHLYIYWLERHAYGSARFCRTFNIAERDLPALRAPFHNLALYNLMQALGVLVGLALRNGADGAHIGGDVLAGRTVATGRRAGEDAMLITQADGKTVELRLGGQQQVVVVEPLLQALDESGKFFFAEDVIQRQHRHVMRHRGKSAIGLAADAAGRRIGGDGRAAGGFQRAQLAHQRVVFGVGNARVIKDIVGVVVRTDFGAQGGDAVGVGHGVIAHGGFSYGRAAAALPHAVRRRWFVAAVACRCGR